MPEKQISRIFQRQLAAVLVVVFAITIVFSYGLQSTLSKSSARTLLRLNVQDMRQDIVDASDENLLSLCHQVAVRVENAEGDLGAFLEELQEEYDVGEISVIDQEGIIIASTYEDFVGFDMGSGEQAREFLVLLDQETEYVQPYGPVSFDSAIWRKYAGVRLAGGGFVQVGYDAERFQKDIAEKVIGAASNRHIGEQGAMLIADQNGRIVSEQRGKEGKTLEEVGIRMDETALVSGEYFEAEVYGVRSHCLYMESEGYRIVSVLPMEEMFYQRNISMYLTIFMEVIISAILFMLVYCLIKKLIVDNIHKINEDLTEITSGNLDVIVDVRSNKEFAILSDDINATVATLKRYIDEAAARIDQELKFAREIQQSVLPSVFPPYPNRNEFDIFAQMTAAKEVGGDFYDFYLVGEDRLAFLVADVSGKGIPAAMFMMTAKTLIKSLAEAGHDVHEIFELANEKLCENNEAEMFLTAWMGILDLKSGSLEFANAGHNPPLLRRAGGEFEYLKTRANFVLAEIEGIRYNKNQLQLAPGDEICLYTDGVPEAMNGAEEFYGDERLKKLLNDSQDGDAQELCKYIKADVDRFVAEAPQFDDITILSLKYKGGK